jgi:predicted ATP-grasp superfamily ATP-dependent carboligase
MKILITDGENRSSLAATRSLGRKGHEVVVTGKKARTLSSSSKYCAKGIAVPDPMKAGLEYCSEILEIVRREGINVIFPMTEPSIYLLNQVRAEIPPGVALGCAPAEKMHAVSDKVVLFRLAERLNVPIPSTIYCSGLEDIKEIAGRIEQYPVVIKPALSRMYDGREFLGGGVRYAGSREELKKIYETSPILRYPSMIQERIVGPGTGLFTLYDNDRHLALFSHRRIREKPPSGGVSVVSESVHLDEEMVEHAGRLLSAVGWEGVAMVEFKRDQRDGKAKLMEINGRFWGTLQLAISCGVDFPSLYLDLLMLRKPAQQIREYQVGHRMKWFFGTLDHLLIVLKGNREALNLPNGYPSKWTAVVEFMRVLEKNTSYNVFDRRDPGPFFHEAKEYVRSAVGRKG